jgi:hypothetical protein
MDIHKITITLARPRGSFPGKVATGYYTVNEGTVTLVDENGVPVDRYKFSRKIAPNSDAKLTAYALVRQRNSRAGSDDFNRPLVYPRMGKI